jgi:hypothetical protein
MRCQVRTITRKNWKFRWGLRLAFIILIVPLAGFGQEQQPHPCHCDSIPFDRSEAEERRVDLNLEFNDYAGVFLDSFDPLCRGRAVKAIQNKIFNTLSFSQSGGKVDSDFDLPLPPFQNWLAGTMVTHIFTSAVEYWPSATKIDERLLDGVVQHYAAIPDRQDPYCGIPGNTCMDDYVLTASGFAWIAAYQTIAGKDARPFAERAHRLLQKSYQPMTVSGSVCYYVVGSNPVRCDGDPKEVVNGSVRIVGTNHGQENPTYGFGLQTAVASTALALAIAQAPFDFTRVEPFSGLTYAQIAVALLGHARGKSAPDGTSFVDTCLDMFNPESPFLPCADSLGYTPNMFPLHRFYQSIGYGFEDFSAGEFHFDRFKPDFSDTPLTQPFGRSTFWGASRFAFYNLYANEAWGEGRLAPHYRSLARSLAWTLSMHSEDLRSR